MSLQITDLRKRFGETQALDGVTFGVEPGQVFGFLGANGAGKTTTMRIVLDILRADDRDRDVAGHAVARTSRAGPSATSPRSAASTRGCRCSSSWSSSRACTASRAGKAAPRRGAGWPASAVPEYADRRAEELSKGNQQKVQFIAAVLHDPRCPDHGRAVHAAWIRSTSALLKAAFLEMRERGKTLIFSTHQMETVEELCDAVAIIDAGRLVANGATADVKRASGKRVVRLGVAGDPELAWLADLDGVHVGRAGRDYSEIEVVPPARPGDDPARGDGARGARHPFRDRGSVAGAGVRGPGGPPGGAR